MPIEKFVIDEVGMDKSDESIFLRVYDSSRGERSHFGFSPEGVVSGDGALPFRKGQAIYTWLQGNRVDAVFSEDKKLLYVDSPYLFRVLSDGKL